MSMKNTPRGVPADAIAIRYDASTGAGRYYVWPNLDREKKVKSWYWHAFGIEGEEPTFDEACAAGRRRIRDGEYTRLT